MKTAEDFRRDMGATEESFRRCVRQTLASLEREEERTVKKKMSMGLALAMAIMLLAAGALAATQWGILDFARKHGQQPDANRLVTEMDQGVYRVENTYVRQGESGLVDVKLEELLYEDGWLYAAMAVKPKQEKTLVIADEMQETSAQTGKVILNALGKIQDINEPGSMKLMAADDASAQMSVKEYANANGFDHVVRVALGTVIKHAEYRLLEDGSLRMIAQMEYNYNQPENEPASMVQAWIPLQVLQYDENGKLPDVYAGCEYLDVQAVGPLVVDERTRTSIPQDAHQIEGYRGYIESVSVTPVDGDQVCVVIQLDQQKRHYGVTQMSGPVAVILDDSGNKLHEHHLYTDIDSMDYLAGDRVRHSMVMPAAGLEEGRITIRLQSRRNHTIIYDEYTYTLE